ncbi:SapC family protein [Catenovulum adriaticum]|uniref:SapC family protein n=1 Tax=Catenovulum adriaticum TaxID=2984846 RepID=A0ABY7AQY8_9ALTE|nr:SapC family protein [Catenovulum sp. TS8]WAJ71968.1 SapC family protein [Catenovulum sp. TS8]
MNTVLLNKHDHKKYLAAAPIIAASTEQVCALSLSEIPKAACCWPIFLSRTNADRAFDVKCLMSLTPERNLFVENSIWTAPFMPATLAVYPFVLANDGRHGYVLATRPCSTTIFDDGDTLLFNELGQPSVVQKQIQYKLQGILNETAALNEFAKMMGEMALTKEINAVVHYSDQSKQVLESLITIDEDKLNNLSDADLVKLQRSGFLSLIHAILNSIFQLNGLILKHNQNYPNDTVQKIELMLPE